MKTLKKSLVRLFVLLVAYAAASNAHAVLVQYDWTGGMSPDGYTAMGTIVIDDSNFGMTLDANTDFVSRMFSWTNGTDTFSVDDQTGTFHTQTELTVSGTGIVTSYQICPSAQGLCNNSGHPATS